MVYLHTGLSFLRERNHANHLPIFAFGALQKEGAQSFSLEFLTRDKKARMSKNVLGFQEYRLLCLQALA
jgi:hypothetical protein